MLHPRVPGSLLRTERTEHSDLSLDIVEGATGVRRDRSQLGAPELRKRFAQDLYPLFD